MASNLAHLRSGQLARSFDLLHFVVSQPDHHVLRFEVSMDDSTLPVHVVQSNQALSSQLPHKRYRHSLVVISLD